MRLTPPTLDQLAKGEVGNVKRVIKKCAEIRHINRWHTRGYTGKRTGRFISDIPIEYTLRVCGCPECRGYGWADWKRDKGICPKCKGSGMIQNPYYQRYFDVEMTDKDRKKATLKFLRVEPKFMTVDKL